MNERVSLNIADLDVTLRAADARDVPAIVDLLSDDPIGAAREAAPGRDDLAPYRAAFAAIRDNPAQTLVVVEASDVVVGTMQLTYVRTLSRRGGLRAQLEALRVRSDCRGSGLGQAMVQWAIDEAHRHGCALVELTSDKRRTEAHRFYMQLGFTASHEGFKLRLD